MDLAKKPKVGDPERTIQRIVNPGVRGEDPARLLVVWEGDWD